MTKKRSGAVPIKNNDFSRGKHNSNLSKGIDCKETNCNVAKRFRMQVWFYVFCGLVFILFFVFAALFVGWCVLPWVLCRSALRVPRWKPG